MAAEITVEFFEGKVTISVNGAKGKTCTDLTKKLEEALGEVTSDTPTKEMFEKPVVQKQKVNA
jgi:hypothetical protein